jgi:hypothetical protein
MGKGERKGRGESQRGGRVGGCVRVPITRALTLCHSRSSNSNMDSSDSESRGRSRKRSKETEMK